METVVAKPTSKMEILIGASVCEINNAFFGIIGGEAAFLAKAMLSLALSTIVPLKLELRSPYYAFSDVRFSD